MKDNTKSVTATLSGNIAESKRMDEMTVNAIEAQGYRIERIEGAIEGLHRLLLSLVANGGAGGGSMGTKSGDKPGGRWAAVKAAQEDASENVAAWPSIRVTAQPSRKSGGSTNGRREDSEDSRELRSRTGEGGLAGSKSGSVRSKSQRDKKGDPAVLRKAL